MIFIVGSVKRYIKNGRLGAWRGWGQWCQKLRKIFSIDFLAMSGTLEQLKQILIYLLYSYKFFQILSKDHTKNQKDVQIPPKSV